MNAYARCRQMARKPAHCAGMLGTGALALILGVWAVCITGSPVLAALLTLAIALIGAGGIACIGGFREDVEWADRGRAVDGEAGEVRRRILAGVGHELHTPLSVILASAEFLLEEESSGALWPAQRQGIERIRQSCEHLIGVIGNVLAVEKLEYLGDKPQIVHMDPRQIVAECVAVARAEAARKDLSFDYTPADAVAPVRADRIWFRQIVRNLLASAIKFVPEAGAVRVAWCRSARGFELQVVCPHTFLARDAHERLVRANTMNAAIGLFPGDVNGFEIALSACLAERLGGQVLISAQEGGGTAFIFVLPIAQTAGQESDPESATRADRGSC